MLDNAACTYGMPMSVLDIGMAALGWSNDMDRSLMGLFMLAAASRIFNAISHNSSRH